MGLHNHWDIVCSITNCQSDCLIIILFDKSNNIGLLTGRNSTANHSLHMTLQSWGSVFCMSYLIVLFREQRLQLRDLFSTLLINYWFSCTFFMEHISSTSPLFEIFHTVISLVSSLHEYPMFSTVFQLISSEHPDLYACLLQVVNSLRDIVLEPVLDSSRS